MTRRPIALGLTACLALGGIACRVAASEDVGTCVAKARDRAAKAAKEGATAYEARRELEIGVAACRDPTLSKDAAQFIGTAHADLARFADDFLQGRLDGLGYRRARLDRARKLRDLATNEDLLKDLRHGDADGDLIPDRRDRCPRTPPGTPTDDHGCPVAEDTRPPAGNEDEFRRRLAGMKLLVNTACDGAPEPLVPQTIRYGRANAAAPLPAGSLMFELAQVGGMPAGCEIFYEIRMRFIEPVDANAPPAVDRNVVFSESEDLDPDPHRVLFGLPVGQPLSPGREATFSAFKIYQRMLWRARTAIGGPVTSPWSPNTTQAPEAGGVP